MSEFWTSIGTLGGQIGFFLIGGAFIVLLTHLKNKAKDWYLQRKLHPIARSVLANQRVHTLLTELRAKTNADRASVFLFHNGQSFSNKNPLWRISCTQECCRTGISHEIGELQNILASFYWDGLAPIVGVLEQIPPGFKIIETENNKTIIVDVAAIEDSYYKRSLMAKGVETNLNCPITNTRTKEIVGYLSLNFSVPVKDINMNFPFFCRELSHSSSLVDFELCK